MAGFHRSIRCRVRPTGQRWRYPIAPENAVVNLRMPIDQVRSRSHIWKSHSLVSEDGTTAMDGTQITAEAGPDAHRWCSLSNTESNRTCRRIREWLMLTTNRICDLQAVFFCI